MRIVNMNKSPVRRSMTLTWNLLETSSLHPTIKNMCVSLHAGGSGRSAADSSAESSVTDSGVEGGGSAASSDDDGDGDSDPDSDRRKLTYPSTSAYSARVQSATSIRILRMPAVQVRVGLSRSTIYESISKFEFPPSISLGARAVGWLESDIDEWLKSRISASKATAVTEWNAARSLGARTQSTKSQSKG